MNISTQTKTAFISAMRAIDGSKKKFTIFLDLLIKDGVTPATFAPKKEGGDPDTVNQLKRIILEYKYTKAQLAWIDSKEVKQDAVHPTLKRTKKSMRDGATSGYLAEIKRQLQARLAPQSGKATETKKGAQGQKRSPYTVKLEALKGVLDWMQNQEAPAFDVTTAVKELKLAIKAMQTKVEVK